MNVYWTLIDLPDWFRTRDMGWSTLTVVLMNRLVKIPGGLSGLFRRVLRIFSSLVAAGISKTLACDACLQEERSSCELDLHAYSRMRKPSKKSGA